MEQVKDNGDNVLKRKKQNIFQRFSHRISKYFNKSKTSNLVKSEDCDLSKSCLDEMPVTSKSHDDLNNKNKYKSKRTKFGNSLNCLKQSKRQKKQNKCIPKINDRCLSEGDLTRDEEQFYSKASPQEGVLRIYESNTSDTSKPGANSKGFSNHKIAHSFKNELALKLRAKNAPKDNESEHSKTPDSPTGIGTSTSPTRQLFGEARTPRSMSSLSHSSNSLLSSNVTNIYGTSDGESMSRSVIDSNDDIGIVVDLATPICKTTTASLLDSTAARQKISASKARRVRPKATTSATSDKTSQNESGSFSPVRDKRDILEEISEEDFPHSPTLSMEGNIATHVDIEVVTANKTESSSPLSKSPKNIFSKILPSTKNIDESSVEDHVSGHLKEQKGTNPHTGSADKASPIESIDTKVGFNVYRTKLQTQAEKEADQTTKGPSTENIDSKIGFNVNKTKFQTHNEKEAEQALKASQTENIDSKIGFNLHKTKLQTHGEKEADQVAKPSSAENTDTKIRFNVNKTNFQTHIQKEAEQTSKLSSNENIDSKIGVNLHKTKFQSHTEKEAEQAVKASLTENIDTKVGFNVNRKKLPTHSEIESEQAEKASPTENIDTKVGFNSYKQKFQTPLEKDADPSPVYKIKLRPTTNFLKTEEKKVDDCTQPNTQHTVSELTNQLGEPSRISRFIPLRPSKHLKSNTDSEPGATDSLQISTANAESSTTAGFGDKRASRVLNMVKNFESVPCADSH